MGATVKRGDVEHLLNVDQLSSRSNGGTVEDQLSWLLSFVNHGRWSVEKFGPSLSIGVFETELDATGYQWQNLARELELFCSDEIHSSDPPLTNQEIGELQKLGASVLYSVAHKGVIMEELPGCKLILFTDRRHKKKKVLINLTGQRRARFLLNVKGVLEAFDLSKLRACRGCEKLFYSETRQLYCTPNGRCSNRTRQKRHYVRSRTRSQSEANRQ